MRLWSFITHACGSLKKKKKRAPSGGAAGGLNKLYSLFTLIPSSWRELQKMQVNMHCMVYSLFGNGNCVYFVLSILEREREREREREKQAPTSCVSYLPFDVCELLWTLAFSDTITFKLFQHLIH
jgi:hypothetical protein